MARRSRTLCSAPLGVPDPLPLRRFGLHMIIPYVLHRSPRRVLLVLFVLVRFVIVIVVIAYVFLRSPVLSCMLVCSYVLLLLLRKGEDNASSKTERASEELRIFTHFKVSESSDG